MLAAFKFRIFLGSSLKFTEQLFSAKQNYVD